MTVRAAWLLVVAFTLALFALGASAQVTAAGGVGLTYGSGTVQVSNGGDFARLLSRSFVPAAQSDFQRLIQRGYTVSTGGNLGVKLSETLRLPIGGAAVDATAVRVMTLPGIAAAAAAVGGAAWAGAQIGAPISKALGHTDVQIGDTRCVATNSGWKCDEGEEATSSSGTVTRWKCHVDHGFTYESASDACDAAIPPTTSYDDYCPFVGTVTITNSYSKGSQISPTAWYVSRTTTDPCTSRQGSSTNPQWGQVGASSAEVSGSTAPSCGPVTDALNPAYSKPAGGSPNSDGKCPTGRYSTKPDSYVADRMLNTPAPQGLKEPSGAVRTGLVQDILTRGGEVPEALPRDLTGPSSAPIPGGATSTTSGTNPDGSPAPTTTTTSGGTVQITYGGDTVSYTTNNTSNTTNNSNSQTSTTTTNEQKDPCVANPDRAGCVPLGTPPTDKPTWTEKPMIFTPEDIGFAGSCPAPFTYTTTGAIQAPLVASWQPLCDVAPLVRLALLALASFSALFFITKQVAR